MSKEYITLSPNNVECGDKMFYRTCSKCFDQTWTKENYGNIFCHKCKTEIHILYRYGMGAGKVNIFHETKEIKFSVIIDSGAFGNGYSSGYNAKLWLSEFNEQNSRIPWTSLMHLIKGYNITLSGVIIEDSYDKRCQEWFENLGCKFNNII